MAGSHLLGYTTCDGRSHLVEHLLLGGELLLIGQIPRCAQGLSARDDGNLKQRVGIGQHPADSGMSCLMVGYGVLLLVGYNLALALESAYYTVDGIQEVLFVDGLLAVTGCDQRRLVADIGYVGAREARSLPCQEIYVEAVYQLEVAHVHLEDVEPLLEFRQLDVDLTVETAGTHQRLVEHIGTVGGCEDDDSGVRAEAVHLGQQLVEGVLPLVVGRISYILAAGAAHGVYLVDEYYAGGFLLGLTEQVADAGGTHADEHFHEVGTRHREERHICLTCHSLGQQSLAGARRAYQQGAFRNLSAEGGVFLLVAQEVDDLHHLHLGLLEAGHILEGNLLGRTVLVVHLSLRLTHVEHAVRPAAGTHVTHRTEEQQPHGNQQHGEQQPVNYPHPVVVLLLGDNLEALVFRHLLQHLAELFLGLETARHEEIELRPGDRVYAAEKVAVLADAVLPDIDLAFVEIPCEHYLLDISAGQHVVLDRQPLLLDGFSAAADALPHVDQHTEDGDVQQDGEYVDIGLLAAWRAAALRVYGVSFIAHRTLFSSHRPKGLPGDRTPCILS